MSQQPKDWQARRAQMRGDAISFVEKTPSSDQAGTTILEVIKDLANRVPEAAEADFYQIEAIASIARRLRDRGLTEWANSLERRSNASQALAPSAQAIEILIGKAAGSFCGRNPGEGQFTFVRHLREVIPFESADFVPAAENALRSTDGATEALAAMLNERIADFQTEPRRLASISDRNFAELSREQSGEIRFVDVWDDPYQRTMIWIHDFDAYELLRRVDHAAYLNLLEDFPLRGGVYQLLDTADGWATTSELRLLLENARPAFDQDGEWIRQNRVAFIVLNLLAGRLLREPFGESGPSDNFKRTLTGIIDALMVRLDAIPLGYAWLQRVLMSPGKSRRRQAMKDDSYQSDALLLVAKNLAGSLGPHPSPLKWIEAELYVWRNWRIYASLAIELSRQPVDKSAIKDLIAHVLLNGFVSSVGIDRLGSGSNIERKIISNAVAQIPNLADWFTDLWRRLFWQRDRFRWLRPGGAARPNVGQVIVLWGICGLELLDSSDEARSLWLALYDAVRESILTEAFRQHNDAWSIALRFLAALWPKTFPNEPLDGAPGSLEALVIPWRRIDISFAQLIEILDRYGVQPGQLRRTGVSGDMLRKIVAESHVRGRPLLLQQEIAAISVVAEKLNGSRGR
jgi:hypothetical protein